MSATQLLHWARLEGRLAAFEDLRAEIQTWVMEERDVAGREALDNVLAHVDAEIAELQRLRRELERG